jgi:hypothetical protein
LHLTCNHFHWAIDWSDLACISLPHTGILHEALNPWRWTHWGSITSRRLETCSVTCHFCWPFIFLICSILSVQMQSYFISLSFNLCLLLLRLQALSFSVP